MSTRLSLKSTVRQSDGTEETTRRGEPPRAEDAPRAVGRYDVVRLLGEGAFGQVFEARDPELDRFVAMKLLHADVSNEVSQQRLRREARALASVQHPNVVGVFDVGTVLDGRELERVWIAMELVTGRSLDEWNEEETRSPERIVEMMREVAEGLDAVHAAGLIHRDFKPGNVLVGEDERPRVADFGLARTDPERWSTAEGSMAALRTPSDPGPLIEALQPNLTVTGAVMGTPAYMAPEQMVGEQCTARSDQFSFFVVLHELLLGQRPFPGKDIHTLRGNVLRGRRVPMPSNHRLPRHWVQALDRGLSVDAELRFDSMQDVLEALRLPPRRRRMAGLVVGGAALLAAVAVPSIGDRQRSGCDDPTRSLGESWSSERRKAVAAGLTQDEGPFVDARALRIEAALDGYAAQWIRGYAEACALPPDDPTRDSHLACLGELRRELEATTDVLAEADEGVVERSVEFVGRLEQPKQCEGTTDFASVDDEGLRLVRLRHRLARVKALHRAGRYGPARELAGVVVAGLDPADDPRLRSDAWHRLGLIHAGSSDYGRSADAFSTAYFIAQQDGLDRLAARSATDLIGIAGGAMGDTEAGATWARHARTHLQRLDDRAFLEALYEQRMGELDWARGEFEEGRAHLQRAVELVEALDPDDPELGMDRMSVALMSIELGEYSDAEVQLQQALTDVARAYGGEHPKVATVAYNLGAAQYEARKLPEAKASWHRSKEILEANFGSNDLRLNDVTSALASISMSEGRDAEARDEFAGILRRLDAAGQGQTYESALAHSNLSMAARHLGEVEVALQHARSSVEIMQRVRPLTHPEVGIAREGLAKALAAAGRVDEAIREAQRAVAIVDEALPENHPVREEAVATLRSVSADR